MSLWKQRALEVRKNISSGERVTHAGEMLDLLFNAATASLQSVRTVAADGFHWAYGDLNNQVINPHRGQEP